MKYINILLYGDLIGTYNQPTTMKWTWKPGETTLVKPRAFISERCGRLAKTATIFAHPVCTPVCNVTCPLLFSWSGVTSSPFQAGPRHVTCVGQWDTVESWKRVHGSLLLVEFSGPVNMPGLASWRLGGGNCYWITHASLPRMLITSKAKIVARLGLHCLASMDKLWGPFEK